MTTVLNFEIELWIFKAYFLIILLPIQFLIIFKDSYIMYSIEKRTSESHEWLQKEPDYPWIYTWLPVKFKKRIGSFFDDDINFAEITMRFHKVFWQINHRLITINDILITWLSICKVNYYISHVISMHKPIPEIDSTVNM